MLSISRTTRVFLATEATDMRKSFDGLFAIVENVISEDPFSDHLFVFRNRRRDRLKILWWDRDGLAIFYKRLEYGTYQFPTDVAVSGKAVSGKDVASGKQASPCPEKKRGRGKEKKEKKKRKGDAAQFQTMSCVPFCLAFGRIKTRAKCLGVGGPVGTSFALNPKFADQWGLAPESPRVNQIMPVPICLSFPVCLFLSVFSCLSFPVCLFQTNESWNLLFVLIDPLICSCPYFSPSFHGKRINPIGIGSQEPVSCYCHFRSNIYA